MGETGFSNYREGVIATTKSLLFEDKMIEHWDIPIFTEENSCCI